MTRTLALIALAAVSVAAAPPKSSVYTGVISESMCGIAHTSMGVAPDAKCIVECIKHGDRIRYVLVDEKTHALYTLSDQQTPEKFAAQRVRVRGVLYQKTNIIAVESIEAAR